MRVSGEIFAALFVANFTGGIAEGFNQFNGTRLVSAIISGHAIFRHGLASLGVFAVFPVPTYGMPPFARKRARSSFARCAFSMLPD